MIMQWRIQAVTVMNEDIANSAVKSNTKEEILCDLSPNK